jgi:hypothetical protein
MNYGQDKSRYFGIFGAKHHAIFDRLMLKRAISPQSLYSVDHRGRRGMIKTIPFAPNWCNKGEMRSSTIMTDNETGPQAVSATMSLQKFMTTELIVSAVINGAFGVLFGWLIVRGVDAVPFSGAGGIVIDVLATAFIIGLLLTLIVTPILRGRIRKGGMPKLAEASLPAPLGLFPQNTFLRGAVMGLGGMVVVAPLILGLFWATGTAQLSPGNFIWIKGVYGALFGVIFTPLALLPMLAGKIK